MARRKQNRETFVNSRDAALWIARRIADGAMPEIGKALAGWLIRYAGGGVALGWLAEQVWGWFQ